MMEMHKIIKHVRALDGALVVAPTRGDDAPELAWGDAFFYGDAGWVSVVNPAERTGASVLSPLGDAHRAAQERAARRMR